MWGRGGSTRGVGYKRNIECGGEGTTRGVGYKQNIVYGGGGEYPWCGL